jgi:hypothetical protein
MKTQREYVKNVTVFTKEVVSVRFACRLTVRTQMRILWLVMNVTCGFISSALVWLKTNWQLWKNTFVHFARKRRQLVSLEFKLQVLELPKVALLELVKVRSDY